MFRWLSRTGRAGRPAAKDPAQADAYWRVPRIDYVPMGRAPQRNLLDDPKDIGRAWQKTVESLTRHARATEAEQATMEREARRFNERLHRGDR